MLVFLGLDWDSAPERSAKLKALQKEFGSSDAKAMNMLGAESLSASNYDRGPVLIVNSHGNRDTFAGLNAQQFFDLLKSKGFGPNSFGKIYLMACKAGEQDQAGTIHDNFARDLRRIFNQHQIPCAIYAPRGTLAYKVKAESKNGQTYLVVTKTYIKTPERDYPLSEGMLLVR